MDRLSHGKCSVAGMLESATAVLRNHNLLIPLKTSAELVNCAELQQCTGPSSLMTAVAPCNTPATVSLMRG